MIIFINVDIKYGNVISCLNKTTEKNAFHFTYAYLSLFILTKPEFTTKRKKKKKLTKPDWWDIDQLSYLLYWESIIIYTCFTLTKFLCLFKLDTELDCICLSLNPHFNLNMKKKWCVEFNKTLSFLLRIVPIDFCRIL